MPRAPRARASRRRLRAATLLLALGFVTSVLVAWTAAFINRDNVAGQRYGYIRGDRWIWVTFQFPSFGRLGVVALPADNYYGLPLDERWTRLAADAAPMVEHGRTVPPALITAAEGEMTDLEIQGGGFSAEAQGWPFRMLFTWDVYAGQPIQTRLRTISGITLTLPLDKPPLKAKLALRPLWPGLLANLAVYGALWFAILFLPGQLRRAHRRRRGRCIRCGYSLAGLPAAATDCPECAEPLDLPRPGAPGSAIAPD